MKFLCNLSTDALDAPDRLNIEFLRWELDGGITAVDTGKLDMLGDGIGQNLTIAGHGIHLNLLRVLYELADDHRMVLADVGGKPQEPG